MPVSNRRSQPWQTKQSTHAATKHRSPTHNHSTAQSTTSRSGTVCIDEQTNSSGTVSICHDSHRISFSSNIASASFLKAERSGDSLHSRSWQTANLSLSAPSACAVCAASSLAAAVDCNGAAAGIGVAAACTAAVESFAPCECTRADGARKNELCKLQGKVHEGREVDGYT